MMKMLKSVIQVAIGAALGVGLALGVVPSCGDNSSHRADGGACDCPASEPPLAGRLVVVAGTPTILQPGMSNGAGAGCPPGAVFLSGYCEDVLTMEDADITIQQEQLDPKSFNFGCSFKNNGLTAVTVHATALCLKPAM